MLDRVSSIKESDAQVFGKLLAELRRASQALHLDRYREYEDQVQQDSSGILATVRFEIKNMC